LNFSQKFFNLTLPDWATEEVIRKLDYFKALSFRWKTKTPEMKRLVAGPMISKILDNFKIRSDIPRDSTPAGESPFQSEEPFRRMRLFSGHDTTIAGVLDTWGVYNMMIPPFASALIMEMHRKPGAAESYIEVSLHRPL
jgi:lysosomal acid phosphatase